MRLLGAGGGTSTLPILRCIQHHQTCQTQQPVNRTRRNFHAMRRGFVIALVVVVTAASIGAYALAYYASQNTQPPQVVLVYQGNTHSGAFYTSCWPSPPANGTCLDRINLKVFPALGTVVARNSSVTFQVVGYSSPSLYRIAIWTSMNGSNSEIVAVKTISNSLPIDLPAGNYYISAFASWSDGRGVGYTFEITVSA